MEQIYYLFLMCITAVGTFFAGVYAKRLAAFYKRLFTRTKRKSTLEQRVEQLETLYAQRERDRKSKVRKQVLEYLNELKK